jgi:hypothetical protein
MSIIKHSRKSSVMQGNFSNEERKKERKKERNMPLPAVKR